MLFIAFVCIGLLWWQIIKLRERQRDFEDRLVTGYQRWNILERQVADLRTPSPPPVVERPLDPEPEPLVEPVPPPPEVVLTLDEVPPPLPVFAAAIPPPLPIQETARVETRIEEQIRKSGGWEELIGGNLLNKLGSLLLVIGISLFLSYSFGRTGPAGRAFTGLGVSVAILTGGVWLERKEQYKLFSRGVMAAGWGSLYFTAYAMHALPAARVIENPTIGVLGMLAVATAMVVHSLKYKSEALTSLSYGTVFAALALSTQNAFVAVALVPLAGSMLFLARRFGWYGMAVFGAAATYTTFLTRPSEGSPLLTIQSILLLYWVMFEAFDWMRLKARAEDTIWTRGLFWLNAIAGLGASAGVWNRLDPENMWQFCAAGAVLYLVSMWVRFLLDENSRYEYALMLSSMLMGLSIFAKVEGIWSSMGLLLEAETLFLAGIYLRLKWSQVLSWLGFAAAFVDMMGRFGQEPVALVGWNVDVWAPPLAVMAVIFYVNRYISKQSWFGFAASAFVWGILGYELPWEYAGAAWLVFAAVLFELGVRKDLVEFRLQGYAVSVSGVLGLTMHPLRTHDAWALGFGVAVTLAAALRGTRWLSELQEIERLGLRIGGSISAALLGGLLMTRVAPEPYWGIAIVALSVGFLELAFRRLPVEMEVPAGGLTCFGILTVVRHAGGELIKYPEQSVWISFLGVALTCYYLTARLLRVERNAIRVIAPWLGSAFAGVSLWMLLPDAWLPAAVAGLGLIAVEAGVVLGAVDFLWLGRVISGAATVLVFGLNLGTKTAETSNGLGIAAAQWWLWYRTRQNQAANIHGWVAAGVVGILIPWQASEHTLAWWGLFGIALAAGGRVLGSRDLRWQAAGLAVIASLWSMIHGDPLWQDAVGAGFLAVALLLERREGEGVEFRKGYSVTLALMVAATILDRASGGMMTLSLSLEGIVLLAAGFMARERMLRLSGLTLLLLCIGKAFVYDLRNLETMFRILSFIGLGAALLLVSWIYTRFREELKRYL